MFVLFIARQQNENMPYLIQFSTDEKACLFHYDAWRKGIAQISCTLLKNLFGVDF